MRKNVTGRAGAADTAPAKPSAGRKIDDVAAALAGFRIAFVAQKRIGVLNGNDTDMQFRSQQALGG